MRQDGGEILEIINRVDLRYLFSMVFMVLSFFSFGASSVGLSPFESTVAKFALIVLCCGFTILKINTLKLHSIYLVVLLYTAYVGIEGIIFSDNVGSVIVSVLQILVVYFGIRIVADKYGVRITVNIIFYLLLVIDILMLLICIATKGAGIPIHENEYVISHHYFFGNKFVISYLNMLLIALAYYKYESVLCILLFSVYGIVFCAAVQCSTGIIGILLMVILYVINVMTNKSLKYSYFVPILLIGMALIAVYGTWIMRLPMIQSFAEGVLGESSDFSNRLNIYPRFIEWFLDKPLFGYGSGDVIGAIVWEQTGASNCQEGLFQIIFSNGLIGAVLFLFICFYSLRRINFLPCRCDYLYMYICSMSIISLVEINLSNLYFLGLSLLYLSSRRSPSTK